MFRTLLLVAVIVVLAPVVAPADVEAAPWVLLHIDTAISKNVCATYTPPLDCQGVVVEQPAGPATFYNVYLVTDTSAMNTYAGVELSIHFTENQNDFAMFSWQNCGDLEFPGPGWGVESGSDNLITFDRINNCQPSHSIIVNGFFYVGAYDASHMDVRPRGTSGRLAVADCSNEEIDISSKLSSAGFGFPGCNPCRDDCTPIPVEDTTWGGEKILFKGE